MTDHDRKILARLNTELERRHAQPERWRLLALAIAFMFLAGALLAFLLGEGAL